jgi:hypothetical protein
MTKLRAIPGGRSKEQRFSLIYGLRLYPTGTITQVRPGEVERKGEGPTSVSLHLIEGTREEIRAQLLASIDAFFDIYGDDIVVKPSSPLSRRSEESMTETGC